MHYSFHIFFSLFCLLLSTIFGPISNAHAYDTKRIVMLGDSLTAGYGLESGQSITTELESIINAQGYKVKIENAGVSGDTTAAGLARLEWAIGGTPAPDLVIVALGANDMLRNIPAQETEKNLEQILRTLKDKKIPTMLIGMQGPTNMGAIFLRRFNALYPALAKKYKTPFYPFMLEGVALKPEYNLGDGIHPNLEGTRLIAQQMAPTIIKALPAK